MAPINLIGVGHKRLELRTDFGRWLVEGVQLFEGRFVESTLPYLVKQFDICFFLVENYIFHYIIHVANHLCRY